MTPALTTRFAGEHFTLNSISEARQAQVLVGLARLQTYLGRPLETATDSDLRAWMVSMLTEDGLAPSTTGYYLKLVLPFYQWCWQQQIITAEHLMRIRTVSVPRGSNKTTPRPYNYKELARFWAQLDARFPYREPDTIVRYRQGIAHFPYVKKHAMRLQLDAIIDLALVCGLRRHEIYDLSLDDMHWDNRYLVVHGKRVDQNDKTREVPYPDSTRAAIREWFRFRGYMGATSDRAWLSVTGPNPLMALNDTRMAHVLRQFGRWELHRLRHTCATERLRAGMSLEKLSRFLGHASVQQTLCYTELVRGDIHRDSERIDADFQRAIRPAPPEAEAA